MVKNVFSFTGVGFLVCFTSVFGLVIFLLSWFPMYDYSSRPAFLDILIFLLEHRFLFTVGKIATGTTVDFVGWVWLYQTGYQD